MQLIVFGKLLFAFQSTRPRGARRRTSLCGTPLASFNPRAREGRDMRSKYPPIMCKRFNPRAREGRDLLQFLRGWRRPVSIHAPARGATLLVPLAGLEDFLFQSTRPRGARRPSVPPRSVRGCFNPRAREGRDPFERNVLWPKVQAGHFRERLFKCHRTSPTRTLREQLFPINYSAHVLPRTSRVFHVRLGFAEFRSDNQRPLHIRGRFCADVLNAAFP